MRTDQLKKAMDPQFVWDRSPLASPMQTLEEMEGSREVARMIFVGLAELHGVHPEPVMDFLDMGYDAWRNNTQKFRNHWKAYKLGDPASKRVGVKVQLCLNAIKTMFGVDKFLALNKLD